MGKFEKHTSYIFLAGTVILFGISIYLLLSGGSSQGVVNRQMGFTLKQVTDVVEDYFHSGNLLKNGKYVWMTESEKENYN